LLIRDDRTGGSFSSSCRVARVGIDRKHLRTIARKYGLIDDRTDDRSGDDES